MATRRLIINADDFGLAPGNTAGDFTGIPRWYITTIDFSDDQYARRTGKDYASAQPGTIARRTASQPHDRLSGGYQSECPPWLMVTDDSIQ